MAKCVGTSSSLRELLAEVRRLGALAEDLASLRRTIQERRLAIERRREALLGQIQDEAAALFADSAGALQRAEYAEAVRLAEVKAQAASAAESAAELCSRQGWLGARLANRLRGIVAVGRAGRRVAGVDAEVAASRRHADQSRLSAQRLLSDLGGEVERRLRRDVEVAQRLEVLEGSDMARGARGELVVEAELRRLPDDFWAFHDLRLRAESFLRFNGTPVQTAQVDHLIVGPTGVFLLETKSWSSQSVSGGHLFDPFEQVGRAGLLCHCLLKDARLPDRVRNVIVSHQRMPASRYQRYTVNVRPDELVGYVRSRKAVLTDDEIEGIATFLRRLVWRGKGPLVRWLSRFRR